MMKRRQVPWIYQYSRLLIGSIAILGICVTAYLTWVKLINNGACGTEGCQIVLASPFANVGNFPLTGLGLVSYVIVAVMAFAPTLIDPKSNKAAHNQLNNLTWLGLFLAGVGMAVFSGYLMYLLAFVIKAACPFCIASAIFTLAILGLTIIGRDWDDIGQLIFSGTAAGLGAIIVSLILYNTAVGGEINSLSPITAPEPGIGWEIKSTSGTAEIELAKYLASKDVKMYSAYWCPHCYEQKQLFGKQAWEQVPNVECAADAKKNPQPQVCTQAGIKGFPTWSINGKLDTGVKKLAKLAELTGYKGDTAFKYDRLFTR
ncbi:vitamin K epoxide reductase family protein [Chamaesiphon minutus]|uniref:Putative membrane protein n=1 Tax=Chamaesiphon minutus (strain ATCC 27169 / PCC 6605) TaxID=1173020 RepID=K9UGI1_CHAP6|nr:vitamin K epoxide reductase family protein [Chamaesiphon minutus]AFY93925.1 putative membrane protein [Chamaesiphon minutus PCC 6605]